MISREPYANGVVFVDFDGCIAISNWRESLLPGNKLTKNYDAFHSMLKFDQPNLWMIDMMDSFMSAEVRTIILTGRMEDNRLASEKWLRKHNVRYDWMEMRMNTDFRPSEVFKAERVAKYYKEEVRMIFDDLEKVTEHLTTLGYPTFLVKAII